MDAVHVHLALNHLPILGPLFALATLAAAWIRRDGSLAKWGLIVSACSALIAIPVFLTGEPAEERIEHLAGVSEERIEAHEESAEAALVVIEIAGAFAILGLFLIARKGDAARWVVPVCALLCLAALGLMARAGNLGGQIRHEEIRPVE